MAVSCTDEQIARMAKQRPMWTHMEWDLGLVLHSFFSMGPGQGMQQREDGRQRRRMGKA